MQPSTLSPANKLQLYFRSGLLFLCVLMLTFIMGLMILALAFTNFERRYKLANFWARTVLWLTKNICDLDYEVDGLDNIPTDSSAIILCKHQSAWETIALHIIFPPQVAVLKRELLWLPIWGWAAATLKPIAIDRKSQRSALRALVKQGTERLNEGLWVLIFPEGTRTAPGEKTKFNAGGSLLAQLSKYPVIPVAHNAGEFWPRYSFLKYPGTIKVRIGPAIQSKDRKAHDINADAEQWINGAMREISLLKKC
jgi:1-acyl-sn-glycerol-3-phosphate acyltransferase